MAKKVKRTKAQKKADRQKTVTLVKTSKDRKTRVKGWGGFSAMYTSIPVEEFDLEEERLKLAAEEKEEMLRRMRSGGGKSDGIKKALADQMSGMKLEEDGNSKKQCACAGGSPN